MVTIKHSSRRWNILTVLWIVSTVFLGQINSASAATKRRKAPIDTKRYSKICRGSGNRYTEISEKDGRANAILRHLIDHSGALILQSKDSAQHKAMCWLIYDDPKKADPRRGLGQFLDRYALVTLFKNTQGINTWDRRDEWLTGKEICEWYGVTCSRPHTFSPMTKRVTSLNLSFNKITGILPRELAFLSELRELDLNGNSLQGVIPYLMLTKLKRLEKLNLHMNDLFGMVPTEFGKLKNLKELTLFGNFFFGRIPTQFGSLKKLELLDLYANNLTGSIPTQLGGLKNIRELYVNDNELVGKMPKELCAMKLKDLRSDCLGRKPEVQCACCTVCCQGLPNPKCQDMTAAKKKK